MITPDQISSILSYPVRIVVSQGHVALDDIDHPRVEQYDPETDEVSYVYPPASRVKPWQTAWAQQCFDSGTILPYDEAKAEQLYNWQQADVPLSVSKPKFFIALYRNHGKKLSDITAVIDGIEDPDARYEAEIELAESAEVQRDNPLIEMIGKDVWGLTDTEINDVFKLAKSLAES